VLKYTHNYIELEHAEPDRLSAKAVSRTVTLTCIATGDCVWQNYC